MPRSTTAWPLGPRLAGRLPERAHADQPRSTRWPRCPASSRPSARSRRCCTPTSRLIHGTAAEVDDGPDRTRRRDRLGLVKRTATANAIRAVEIGISLIGNPALSRRTPSNATTATCCAAASTRPRTTRSPSPPARPRSPEGPPPSHRDADGLLADLVSRSPPPAARRRPPHLRTGRPAGRPTPPGRRSSGRSARPLSAIDDSGCRSRM